MFFVPPGLCRDYLKLGAIAGFRGLVAWVRSPVTECPEAGCDGQKHRKQESVSRVLGNKTVQIV